MMRLSSRGAKPSIQPENCWTSCTLLRCDIDVAHLVAAAPFTRLFLLAQVVAPKPSTHVELQPGQLDPLSIDGTSTGQLTMPRVQSVKEVMRC